MSGNGDYLPATNFVVAVGKLYQDFNDSRDTNTQLAAVCIYNTVVI